MRQLLGTIALTAVLCGAVSAQSATADLVNPSSISFEQDGKDVTGFVAYVTAEGAAPLRIELGPLRPDNKGKVVARIPVLSPGNYSIQVAAYNTAGESPRVPAVPIRFRITGQNSAAAQSIQASTPTPGVVEPDKSAKKEPAKATSKKKSGIFGRVYGAVVGSDEEESGK
jgi:hypothetical protein